MRLIAIYAQVMGKCIDIPDVIRLYLAEQYAEKSD